jgi:hypothetical protein
LWYMPQDELRWHDMHTNSHKDRFGNSNNTYCLPQQSEGL